MSLTYSMFITPAHFHHPPRLHRSKLLISNHDIVWWQTENLFWIKVVEVCHPVDEQEKIQTKTASYVLCLIHRFDFLEADDKMFSSVTNLPVIFLIHASIICSAWLTNNPNIFSLLQRKAASPSLHPRALSLNLYLPPDRVLVVPVGPSARPGLSRAS